MLHPVGIPLKSVVGDASAKLPPMIEPKSYPVKEMFIRGFFAAAFGSDWSKVKERAEEMLQEFFTGRQDGPIGAFNRQTTSKKSKVDIHAVHAWRCRVLDRAATLELPSYDPEALDDVFIKDLTKLSRFPTGPLLVQQALHEIGIAMIVEPHLMGTHLDGAAIWHPDGFPIIALTLRHDRLDNFWFTLFHELGHVKNDLTAFSEGGFIDTDIDGVPEKEIERDADRFALNAFVSELEWDQLSCLNCADEIKAAAKKLSIHPAIIAGRLRREANDYRKHRTLIGQGKVKELFRLA
jgi:HTH-type transcriptional regulator/antitoxin HigA